MSHDSGQDYIAYIIVAICAAFLLYNAWRTIRSKGKGCGCGVPCTTKKEPQIVSIQLGESLLGKSADQLLPKPNSEPGSH